MKPTRVLVGIAAILIILVLVQGVHAGETYTFVKKWGDHGSTPGHFEYLWGLAVDSAGNTYVPNLDGVNVGAPGMQKFTPDGALAAYWGTLGNGGNGKFRYPLWAAVDKDGYVYVLDQISCLVQKFTSTGTFVSQWGGYGSGDNQLLEPYNIAVDKDGYVYVIDKSSTGFIKIYTSSGTFVTRWGSSGAGDGQFNSPGAIAVDKDGIVYVTDFYNYRIEKFTPGGTYKGQWGSYGTGDGQFSELRGIAVDAAGYVYVVDNDRIQKFTSNGAYVTQWGSYGTGDGQFYHAIGIGVDEAGYVYVDDTNNYRVQVFALAPPIPGGTPVTSCTIINAPGLYTLQNDITELTLTKCIEITSSDVIFDGYGHIISGGTANLARYGVFVHNNGAQLNNVTIIQTDLMNWGHAIQYGFTYYGINNGAIKWNIVDNNYEGINLVNSNSNNVNSNYVRYNQFAAIGAMGAYNNLIYNNVFNNSNNGGSDNPNFWNTTKTPGINEIGGPNLGGNFWGTPAGTGFSQMCTDADNDGICDSAYTFSPGNIDYLPLGPYPPSPTITVITPNGGETWNQYTSANICWTYTGDPGLNVAIVLLKGGSDYSIISASTPITSLTYAWADPSIPNGNDYAISIRSISYPAITDTSDNTFTLLFAPPPSDAILDTIVELPGTYFMDLDTGLVVDNPLSDVWWEQMTSTTRQLVPENGATIVNLGLKTDTEFDVITAAQLAQQTYSTNPIRGDDGPPNNQAVVGDVFAAYTNGGNYAKAKILSKTPHAPPPGPADIITLHLVVYSGSPIAAFSGAPLSGTVPPDLLVTFTDASTGGTPPYSYEWDFGDGTPHSSLQNPTHYYTTPREYTVTLIVTDAAGKSGTAVKPQYIKVSPYSPPACFGGISVTSTPSGATIFKDGAATGETTPHLFDSVPCGLHTVNVTFPSGDSLFGKYYDELRYVSVEDGKTSDVAITMSEVDPGLSGAELQAVKTTSKILLGGDTTGKAISVVKGEQCKPTIKLWNGAAVTKLSFDCCKCHITVTDTCNECNIGHLYKYSAVDDITGEILEIKYGNTPATNVEVTFAQGKFPSPGEPNVYLDPPVWTPSCGQNCNDYYALLISGGVNKTVNHIRYWNDIAFVYNTLIEYGYPRDHITVLMSDGRNPGEDRHYANSKTTPVTALTDNSPTKLEGPLDTTDDVNGEVTYETLTNNLTRLNSLPLGKTLFIFTTSHGDWDQVIDKNNAKLYLWGDDQFITDEDFVSRLNPNLNITMVMEQCYAGGFINNFMGLSKGNSNLRRVIITAANGNEPSQANGFSNAWTQGVAGHDLKGVKDLGADTTTPPDKRVSMRESFEYAKNRDPFATIALALVTGKEHPLMDYSPTTGTTQGDTTQYLNDCTGTASKSIAVTVPTGSATIWQRGSQHYIFWTETGLPSENVKITLENATKKIVITDSSGVPAAQQSYKWIIPVGTIKTGTDYKINVSTMDNRVFGRSPSNFQISAQGGTGSMNITSLPDPGARIWMDGVDQGENMLTIPTGRIFSSKIPGDYLVKVENNSYYYPATMMLLVQSGSENKTAFTLSSLESGTNSLSVDVASVPYAIVSNGAITPSLVKMNYPDPVLLSATVDGSNGIGGAEYCIDDCSAWTPMSAKDGGWGGTSEGVQATIPASAYSAADVKYITIRGIDTSGNRGEPSDPLMFVVYDPTAGFVTGGGFYNSPAGSVANPPTPPDEKGKVVFGFVSKYNRGVLKGETNFVFHSKTIPLAIFHSESYEWLVVSGNTAQYKGTGTINGAGQYSFILTTKDGDVKGDDGNDYLRLKIWDKMNVNAPPVYDNQRDASDFADPTMKIGFGNIKVHKS